MLPSIFYKRAKGFYALTVLFTFAYTANPISFAQTDIPDAIRQALIRNASTLNPITVAWEERFSSRFSLEELKQQIAQDLDQTFFEPTTLRYSRQNDMYYRHRIRQMVINEKQFGRPLLPIVGEWAFDGKVVYTGNKIRDVSRGVYPSLKIDPLQKHLRENPDDLAVDARYLEESGFLVRAKYSELPQSLQSLVLSLIQKGAKLSTAPKTDSISPNGVLFELSAADATYRFQLEPTLGFAIRRWEKLNPSGSILRQTDNDDFVRLANTETWLPKHCRVRYHTWWTIPERITDEPLAVADITVSELHNNLIPDERFVLKYSEPGSRIYDCTFPEGLVSYTVPANPDDLDQAIKAARTGDSFHSAQRERSGWFWTLIFVLNVCFVAVVIYLIWRSRVLKNE